MDFSDKAVLVTGASRGIGRAVAEAFAQRGARVALHYNANQTLAAQVLSGLPGEGHSIHQANLAEASECQRLVEAVHGQMGRIDVLVNNAGIWEPVPFESLDYEAWQATWKRTLSVNLVGPANLSFLAAHVMAAHGGGRIVNVSSRGAFRGEPQAPAYGASKAGLNALGQSLAIALAPLGILVGTVAPGFVETGMTATLLAGPEGESIRRQSPLGRTAQPEEIARAVLYLAAPGNEFATGAIIDVNGASYLRS